MIVNSLKRNREQTPISNESTLISLNRMDTHESKIFYYYLIPTG